MIARITMVLIALTLVTSAAGAQTPATKIAERLDRALRAAGVAIVGVSIGSPTDKATWTVQPRTLQSAAQPTIDAFDPNDAAHEQADLDRQVRAALDNERLSSAMIWTILKQMYPTDTDAQTKTKFGVARTRIITAYTRRPWAP